MIIKKCLLFFACLTLGLFASANADVVVYQDTFANDDLAVNPDIGGGLSENIAGGAGFTETGGSIVGDNGVNNNRAYGYSTDTFSLTDGFTLNFIANSTDVAQNSNNRFSVGLVESGAAFPTLTTAGQNYLGSSDASFEGFGVNFTPSEGQGLKYNDGAGTVATLDNGQTIAANTELDVTLTVDSSGNYTYSINGATASTGTTALDLTKEYHFATYFQDNVGEPSIREVTLTAVTTAVPEPSSMSLIGLGGLVLLLRRKKIC